MTELSTTEAKIEQAAKDYGIEQSWRNDRNDDAYCKEDFTAGASFATTDPSILQAIFNKFHDWCEERGIYKDVYGEYYHVPHGSAVLFARSERELTDKYIQHLQTNKQKEDGK